MQGTAPASPSGQNYNVFNASLMSAFGIGGTSSSFLAQAYDATYVGAYGVVYASKGGSKYDGIDVANGMAHLEGGAAIPLGALQWTTGKTDLVTAGQIAISGTSGPLQFDPKTGEAPGPILVWGISAAQAFTMTTVVQPPEVRGTLSGVPQDDQPLSTAVTLVGLGADDADAADAAAGDVGDDQREALALDALAGLGGVLEAREDVAAHGLDRPGDGLEDDGGVALEVGEEHAAVDVDDAAAAAVDGRHLFVGLVADTRRRSLRAGLRW